MRRRRSRRKDRVKSAQKSAAKEKETRYEPSPSLRSCEHDDCGDGNFNPGCHRSRQVRRGCAGNQTVKTNGREKEDEKTADKLARDQESTLYLLSYSSLMRHAFMPKVRCAKSIRLYFSMEAGAANSSIAPRTGLQISEGRQGRIRSAKGSKIVN